jgi:hypothetical protein
MMSPGVSRNLLASSRAGTLERIPNERHAYGGLGMSQTSDKIRELNDAFRTRLGERAAGKAYNYGPVGNAP